MSISVVQAVLIGIVYYLGINGTPWLTCLGSTIIQKPLVSGVIVGFILGDPVQGAIIGAAIPVSYTHLDVYKRQGLPIFEMGIALPVLSVSFQVLQITVQILIGRNHFF